MLVKQFANGETCVNGNYLLGSGIANEEFQEYYELPTKVEGYSGIDYDIDDLIQRFDKGCGYVIRKNNAACDIVRSEPGFLAGGCFWVGKTYVALFYDNTSTFKVYKDDQNSVFVHANGALMLLPSSYESTFISQMTHVLPVYFASFGGDSYFYLDKTSEQLAGIFRADYALLKGTNVVGLWGFDNSSFTFDVIPTTLAGVRKNFLSGNAFGKTPLNLGRSYGVVFTQISKANCQEFCRQLANGSALPTITWAGKYPVPSNQSSKAQGRLLVLNKVNTKFVQGLDYVDLQGAHTKIETAVLAYNGEKIKGKLTKFINSNCTDVANCADFIRMNDRELQNILDQWQREYEKALEQAITVIDTSVLKGWFDPDVAGASVARAVRNTDPKTGKPVNRSMSMSFALPTIKKLGDGNDTLDAILSKENGGYLTVDVEVDGNKFTLPKFRRASMSASAGHITTIRSNMATYACLFKNVDYSSSNLCKEVELYSKNLRDQNLLVGGLSGILAELTANLTKHKIPELKSEAEISEMISEELEKRFRTPIRGQLDNIVRELEACFDASNYQLQPPRYVTPSYANSGNGPLSRNDYSYFVRDGYWTVRMASRKTKLGITIWYPEAYFKWDTQYDILPGAGISEDEDDGHKTGGASNFNDWQIKLPTGFKTGNERTKWKNAHIELRNVTPTDEQKKAAGIKPGLYTFSLHVDAECDNYWIPVIQEAMSGQADSFVGSLESSITNQLRAKGWSVTSGRTASYIVEASSSGEKVKYARNFSRAPNGDTVEIPGYKSPYYSGVRGLTFSVQKDVKFTIDLTDYFANPFKGNADPTSLNYNDPSVMEEIVAVEDGLFAFQDLAKGMAAMLASKSIMERFYNWFKNAGYISTNPETGEDTADIESVRERLQMLVEFDGKLTSVTVASSFSDVDASLVFTGFENVKHMLTDGRANGVTDDVDESLTLNAAVEAKKAQICAMIAEALIPTSVVKIKPGYRFFDSKDVDPETFKEDLNAAPVLGVF